ncbi:RluA family pseudouridine synthase [Candidatus Saganbacteria bacterium]|nr:RluA family pseudouridine synthase [Candidatus Saganbacteria bacterium]
MEYFIKEQNQNKRLDVFVSKLDIGLSRSQAKRLIDHNEILLNGLPAKSSHVLRPNDKVAVNIPKPAKLEAVSQDIPLNIIYEDQDLIVVNKPRGMVVHPAAGNYSGTLVNALLFHCKDLSGIGGVMRPGIVHRLDKDTTGVIVATKNDNAHASLSKQFKDHAVKKIYLALVKGIVKDDKGEINEPIGRHPVNRKKMAVISRVKGQGASGKTREAYTEYEVVKRFSDTTLLTINLGTGRTHQIRVHMAHLGHPLVGDPVYGKGPSTSLGVNGQMLHAETLGFKHPTTGKYMEFKAEMPDDMKVFLVDHVRS